MKRATFATFAAIAATAVLSCPAKSQSESVTLTSRDGSLALDGTLLGYDGEFFRIDTAYGVLTVDGAGVTCTGTACPSDGGFAAEGMISGAAVAGATLVPDLIEAYASRHGYSFVRQDEDGTHALYVLTDLATGAVAARIRLRFSTSAEGFADLLADQADVAISFRPVTPEERALALDAGLGDLASGARAQILALDGIVPVVSRDNPLVSIALRDLALIHAARLRRWDELGAGKSTSITLHLPSAVTGLAESIEERIGGGLGPGEGIRVIRHGSLEGLAAAVAADPNALGLTAVSQVGDARPLAIAGGCGAVIRPEPQSLKTEDFPLTAPHYLYSPGRRLPRLIRHFLDFVGSPAAQDVIRGAGFADQEIDLRPLAAQGDRLAQAILATGAEVGARDLRRMVASLSEAEQLSVTFRFEGGSSDLDPQSRANVALLAEAISRGTFDGQTLLFAGFSDGQGDAAGNLNLSKRRAEAARSAILAALGDPSDLPVTLTAEGFGEAMPLACDEDEWGRQANRRVEVWLRQR